jgi:hypothetical protein
VSWSAASSGNHHVETYGPYFEAVNDDGNQTSFLVDDAAVTLTQ